MAVQNPTTPHSYWVGMKDKAAKNLAGLTKKSVPETEMEAKKLVACAMKYGNYEDAACAIGEYCEWIMGHLMLKMHNHSTATVGA